MKTFFATLFFSFFSILAFAGKGFEIKVKIDGFEEQELYLGYYLLDKQYLRDTALINKKGEAVFSGDEPLEGGVYIIVVPPENQFVQILVDEQNQHFSIHTDLAKLVDNMEVKGSSDNTIFYDYLKFLNQQRSPTDKLRKQLEESTEDSQKAEIQTQIDKINAQVKDYQQRIVNENPNSLVAAITKSTFEVDMPEFEGTDNEKQVKRWKFYREHYFDYIDLQDDRMLRTPLLYNRIDYYLEKLTVQHPDSISKAIDYVLGKMNPESDMFKFYVVDLLNKYAKSKFIGMDAVYVHMVEQYYMTGKASWTEEEQLEKIIDNAKTLKPLLIGKVAPDLALMELDIEGTIQAESEEDELKRVRVMAKKSLHGVEAPYTVLVFWAPDCGHCKKSMPKVKEFYDAYKSKGVEVYAVCGKTVQKDGMVECAKMIKEKNLTGWLNMVDPYYQTKFKTTYDIRTTPQIYILDKKKEIVSKRIGAEQLKEVMDQIMEMDSKKANG